MLSYSPIYNKVNVFSLKPGKQRYIVTIAGFSHNGEIIALVAPVNALNFWEAKAKTVCSFRPYNRSAPLY